MTTVWFPAPTLAGLQLSVSDLDDLMLYSDLRHAHTHTDTSHPHKPVTEVICAHFIDGGFKTQNIVTCPVVVRSGVPHGGQDDAVEQAAVQPLGHLQSCPLHGDRGDKAQRNTQAAEHSEYHGIDRLVQGTFLSRKKTRMLCGYVWALPSLLLSTSLVMVWLQVGVPG